MPAAAGARELYVYYRIRADAEATADAALDAIQRGLRERHPGLVARRLRQPGANASASTWMEVYARPGRGIDAQLEAEIAEAATALAPCRVGDRHVEVFFAIDDAG